LDITVYFADESLLTQLIRVVLTNIFRNSLQTPVAPLQFVDVQ